MKKHQTLTPRQEAQNERSLFQAVLALRDASEVRAFFHDLCTPAELQALVDRWLVVSLLERDLAYREIRRQTGVSVTTIGRVARCLANGQGGYALVRARQRQGEPA